MEELCGLSATDFQKTAASEAKRTQIVICQSSEVESALLQNDIIKLEGMVAECNAAVKVRALYSNISSKLPCGALPDPSALPYLLPDTPTHPLSTDLP